MAYIDFGRPPVKEGETKLHFSCDNCIHKIFIPGGIYRCSITNNYMFFNQYSENKCNNKDEQKNIRKCLFGVFTYDENGIIKWMGLLSYCILHNINDDEGIKDLYKDLEKDFVKKHPNVKDMVLIHCLIAESKYNSKFVIKTNLIPKEILEDIVEEANKKFL